MAFKKLYSLNVLMVANILQFNACGHKSISDKESNVKPEFSVIAHDTGSPALLFGQGFDFVKNEGKGLCVETDALKNETTNSISQNPEFKIEEINSEFELRNYLGVSASASFGALFAKPSSRNTFVESINKSSQSKYLMVHARVANELKLGTNYKLSAEAMRLITENKSPEFYEKCGNKFVYAQKNGSEFYSVLEFDMTSAAQSKAFTDAVALVGNDWKPVSEVRDVLINFNRHAFVQAKMLKMGGSGDLPKVEKFVEFIDNFEKFIEAISGAPVTLQSLAQNYSSIEPMIKRENIAAVDDQLANIEKLALARDKAQEFMNSLDYIKNNKKVYDTQEFDFTTALNKFTKYMSDIKSTAIECINSAEKCAIPIAQLELNLPLRGNVSRIWKEIQTENWAFEYPSNESEVYFHESPQLRIWTVRRPLISWENSEYKLIYNEYVEKNCTKVFEEALADVNSQDFEISTTLESKVAIRELDPKFGITQISFAVKDKASEKCLKVSFYNLTPMNEPFILSGNSEVTNTILRIVKSIRKI